MFPTPPPAPAARGRLPTSVCVHTRVSALGSTFWLGSMKHVPRVVAEHPSGGTRHGGNATVPTCEPFRANNRSAVECYTHE
eukprot:scaffold93064_cov104-Phaeocystis_antarctica.AAC.4